MVDVNEKNAPETPLSPGTHQRVAFGVAGGIAAIAIVLAILIALRAPQYEAESRLAYSPSGAAMGSAAAPSAPGAATSTAAGVLTDSELAHLIDRFDLFPDLRQKQSTAALTGRLRDRLSMTEPEAGILQVAFRDADQAKTAAVTNGIASLLAGYQLMQSVPMAAVVDPASKQRRDVRSAKKDAARARAVPAPPPVVTPAPVLQSSATNAAYVAELTHQVDRVDATMHDMQDARTELETEQHQVAGKIEALEKSERRTAEAHAGGRSEAVRSERSVAEQDLAVEKAKLASLRERYTDAYPDVQATEEDIAKLQAKLASLPSPVAASERVTPTAEQSEAMDKLRVERQRVERDLGQNQATLDAEGQRKVSLLAQIQQAKYRRPFQAGPQPANVPPAPAAVAEPAIPSDNPQVPTMQVPVLPFRVVETAGTAALVTTSRLALSLWLVLGTAVLLALCFVPLVPAHYAAVVTSPEDLEKSMPEHVSYLGDVGRTEP